MTNTIDERLKVLYSKIFRDEKPPENIKNYCYMKLGQFNKDSTTFADYYKLPYRKDVDDPNIICREEHPIHKCYNCSGVDTLCNSYHKIKWFGDYDS